MNTNNKTHHEIAIQLPESRAVLNRGAQLLLHTEEVAQRIEAQVLHAIDAAREEDDPTPRSRPVAGRQVTARAADGRDERQRA